MSVGRGICVIGLKGWTPLGARGREVEMRCRGRDWVKNGRGYPPGRLRGVGVVSCGLRWSPGRKRKLLYLVLSKRDRTPLVADFTHFESDRK